MQFCDGPYSGVSFAINRVSIKEDVLDFHYDLIDEKQLHLKNDPAFIKELGDFIVYLLSSEYKIGKYAKRPSDRHSSKSS